MKFLLSLAVLVMAFGTVMAQEDKRTQAPSTPAASQPKKGRRTMSDNTWPRNQYTGPGGGLYTGPGGGMYTGPGGGLYIGPGGGLYSGPGGGMYTGPGGGCT